MDDVVIGETLEALADGRTALARQREIRPLRGIRGVPDGELAKVLAAVWAEEPVVLSRDEAQLDTLFGAAFEDGLVAVGLLAAAAPDDAHDAWDIAKDWLARVDDPITADALGWLVLGPAWLVSQQPIDVLSHAADRDAHPAARRAMVMAGLALTPEPIVGPAAAALRARLGERHLRFVDEAQDGALSALLDATWRDEAPMVRKACRRVLRAWVKSSPAGAVAWADAVRGGLPKLLGAEVAPARKRLAKESP